MVAVAQRIYVDSCSFQSQQLYVTVHFVHLLVKTFRGGKLELFVTNVVYSIACIMIFPHLGCKFNLNSLQFNIATL